MAAALLLLIAAWLSIGFHQYDEHFQLLEFANFKLGLTPPAHLPWEYGARIRSWFQPAVAFVVLRALRAVGDSDPFHAALVLRLLSAVLYWAAFAGLVRRSRSWFRSSEIHRLAIAVGCGLWFVPYLAVRFSGESWSGSLFFLGLAPLIQDTQDESVSLWELALAGSAMGLAFAARYQSAILILAALAWFVRIGRARPSAVAAVIAGIAVTCAAGLLLDRWGYAVWTFAPWNYLDANLLQGTAARRFGASPWWWYLTKIPVAAGPPIGVLLLLGVPLAWWRRPHNPLTWITLTFFLAHTVLGHKELRFLFPLLLAVPFLVFLALDATPAAAAWWLHSRTGRVIGVSLLLLDGLGLALRLSIPARSEIGLQRAVHDAGSTLPLYLDHDDPYLLGGLHSDFYRLPGQLSASITDSAGGSRIAALHGPFLIASLSPMVPDTAALGCRVLYRSYPDWVRTEAIWSTLRWAEPRQWTLVRCEGRPGEL